MSFPNPPFAATPDPARNMAAAPCPQQFGVDGDSVLEIVYRKARIEDALPMAVLIRAAAGGVLEYLFYDLVHGLTPVQAVAMGLEQKDRFYSYRNAIVAEHQGMVVGIALAYPSDNHRITREMVNFFPAERLDHLRSFYDTRVEGSLYLDSLAVDAIHRRRGIGSCLLERTKKRARRMGLDALSLMVFADNEEALGLYEKAGFEEVRRVDLAPNAFIPHEGGCLLLRCSLGTAPGAHRWD